MSWRLKLDEAEEEVKHDQLPRDFLPRFYKRVGKGRGGGHGSVEGIFTMGSCSYHEHKSDADMTSCSKRSKHILGTLRLVRAAYNGRAAAKMGI
jgi:hypothetical protein